MGLYVSTGPVAAGLATLATGKELFFVDTCLSSRDDRCTANAEIVGKGLFQVYWLYFFGHISLRYILAIFNVQRDQLA